MIGSTKKSALIFIHGYCNSFDDAAIRTAQIVYDLDFQGVAAFYSWPSTGTELGYWQDEENVRESTKQIATFLYEFVNKSGVDAVHLIAHSMGNRALIMALEEISNQVKNQIFSPIRFDEIVLAAPDFDEETFQQLQEHYHRLGKRSTLYVSRNDRALQISARLHDNKRVGLSIKPWAGFDVVDVGKVDLSTIGHSYIADCIPVIEDLNGVIATISIKQRSVKNHTDSLDGIYMLLVDVAKAVGEVAVGVMSETVAASIPSFKLTTDIDQLCSQLAKEKKPKTPLSPDSNGREEL